MQYQQNGYKNNNHENKRFGNRNNNRQFNKEHNNNFKQRNGIPTKSVSNNDYKNINLTLENSLNKISFCDKECFNINNNQTKDNIISYVQSKFKIKIIEREYVSLNPHMLRNISNHEHYLATYSNGNPYLIWFTKIDGKNCSIFIDRKLKDGYSYPKIHLVQYDFDDHIFETDMIVTGELVRDINREWCYLISDLIIYEGEDITKTKNILSRFNLLYTILDKHYKPNTSIESCPLYVKKLWQYSDINTLFDEYLPSLSYVCKGIVFYTMNNNFSNYAWIMPKEHQIRVKTAKDADIEFYKQYPQYKDIGGIITSNKTLESNGENEQTYYANSTFSNKTTNVITEIDNEDNNWKYCVSKLVITNMIKKVEKCIKHMSQEHGEELDCNIQYKNLSVIKTSMPGIYKCLYENDLSECGILYIPYLELDKFIYELFINKEDKTIKNDKVTMKCIYYEIFDKWVPISYKL